MSKLLRTRRLAVSFCERRGEVCNDACRRAAAGRRQVMRELLSLGMRV